MSEEPPASDVSVSDEMIRGMVAELAPGWEVRTLERSPHGTDAVVVLDVETPAGEQRAVLKATTADFVEPRVTRAELRLLKLMGERTAIPVPEVFGYRDAHERYPAPFYLMEYVVGENYEGKFAGLGPRIRERILREAGANLAALHDLDRFDRAGAVGVRDGELAILDSPGVPASDSFVERFREGVEGTLDDLETGSPFADLADDPARFSDLVPEIRPVVRDRLATLSEPNALRYSHWDYRPGNLLVDPEMGRTEAVLDWANLRTADPAYNLAKVEHSFLDSDDAEPDERREELRGIFREAYTARREGWQFGETVEGRMRFYRFTSRLDAMVCLPLWYRDATTAERDGRAAEHRAFVREFLRGD